MVDGRIGIDDGQLWTALIDGSNAESAVGDKIGRGLWLDTWLITCGTGNTSDEESESLEEDI